MSTIPRRSFLLTAALFLVIILTLGGLNAHYLFHTELYEHGDLAANSLAIREAKSFHRLTGQYSRWGFSHPGPGWFYAMAAGEALFYDAWQATPTPWNAQLLVVLLINGAFLAVTIGIVVREAEGKSLRAATVGALLLFLVVYLGVLGQRAGVMDNWMPNLMLAPFACLVIASAAVGAGRGMDLPVLTLAGAALLHSHVAQPLFVVPLVGLAWLGLAARYRGRPWREFPRSHVVALVIVLLAALPVALDAMRGKDSNLALILAHRRTHAGEGHSWLDALGYNLRLVGFTPIAAGDPQIFRGGSTWATLGSYVSRHVSTLTLWAGATLLLAAGSWRSRFGANLLASVTVAAGLAVCWAAKQDGEMFYFNSWFVYGLLLALAFGAVAAGVRGFGALFPRAARTPWPAVALLLLTAGLVAARPGRLLVHANDEQDSRNLARSVDSALAEDTAGTGRVKYLAFVHHEWEDAVAVALQLARHGERFRTPPDWDLMFGPGTSVADPREFLSTPENARIWRILPPDADPDAAARRPLYHHDGLSLGAPAVDPAGGTEITFAGPHPNAAAYVLSGWSSPTPGDPFTWSEKPTGVMAFRAVPVPVPGPDVEITVDASPALTPGRVEAQRLELLLNDQPLGQWTVRADEAPLRVRVPAATWNARPEALLTWRFPDAVSPMTLGQSSDPREIGFGFRAVRFGFVE